MKKAVVLSIVLTLMLVFAGCGKSDNTQTTPAATEAPKTTSAATDAPETAAPTETEAAGTEQEIPNLGAS